MYRYQHLIGNKNAETHGLSKTPEYRVWIDMKRRCLDQNHSKYSDWGARGVTICQRWVDSFEAFRHDMRPRPTANHTIERKDNSGNYEPNNCVWATMAAQSRNRRNNKVATFNGRTMIYAEWARELNISRSAFSARIKRLGICAKTFTKGGIYNV